MHYLLIAMVDFTQQVFRVDGKGYESYLFTLSGDTKTEIRVEMDVEEKAKEATFMIVEEPDFLDITYENAPTSAQFYAFRIPLSEDIIETMVYDGNCPCGMETVPAVGWKNGSVC